MSFEALKQKYISTFIEKRNDLQAAWDNKDIAQLHGLLHKLAGSAGGYGFDNLGALSRQGMELTNEDKIVDYKTLEKCYHKICLTLQSYTS